MLKITKVKPMFTGLVTTMDRYDKDVKENGVVTIVAGTLKQYQTVVAIGSSINGINVGDKVMLDLKRFSKVKQPEDNSIKEDLGLGSKVMVVPDIVEINGEPYLLLQDRDIAYIFEGEEVEDETPKKSKLWKPTIKA